MRVSMYIPEKGHNGRDGQNAQDLVVERFVEMFGGCTVSGKQRGFWMSDRGKMLEEDVRVIEAYSELIGNPHPPLVELATRVKNMLAQESVLYTVDTEPFFV